MTQYRIYTNGVLTSAELEYPKHVDNLIDCLVE